MRDLRWTVLAGLLACNCTASAEAPPTIAPPRIIVTVSPSPTAQADDEPAARPAAQSSPPPVVVRPLASPGAVALPLSVLVGRSGSDLRVGLDLVFEENLYLSGAALDAAVSHRTDELAGIARTLDQTSSTLAAIVGAVRGLDAQQALLEGLRRQTADVLGYATQSRPAPGGTAGDELLRQRGQVLAGFAETARSDDAGRITTALLGAASHADDVTRPLAADLAARVPAQIAGSTQDAEVDLRLAIDRRLQARVYLLGRAMSAASDGRDSDRQVAARAADAVADELSQTLGAVYGDSVAGHIAGALRDRNAALLRALNDADRDAALNGLDGARGELDATFSSANPLLPRGMLTALLRSEDQETLAALGALSAHDWAGAESHVHQAARLSQRFGDALSEATTDRYPSRFMATPTPTPP